MNEELDLTNEQWALFRLVENFQREHPGKSLHYKEAYDLFNSDNSLFIFKMDGTPISKNAINDYPKIEGNFHDSLAIRTMRDDWNAISTFLAIDKVCMSSPNGMKIAESKQEANEYLECEKLRVQRMWAPYSVNKWRNDRDGQGRIPFTQYARDHNEAYIVPVRKKKRTPKQNPTNNDYPIPTNSIPTSPVSAK